MSRRYPSIKYGGGCICRCSMTDLPEELDRVPDRKLGDVLDRVFSGELVGYHPGKGLIAVWSGGTGFNVYDPEQWFRGDGHRMTQGSGETGEVHYFNTTDPSRLDDPEQNARETLEGYGFEVVG